MGHTVPTLHPPPRDCSRVGLLFLSAALAIGGCGRHELLPVAPNSAQLSEATSLGAANDPLCVRRPGGAQQITGVDAHGALYALYRPSRLERRPRSLRARLHPAAGGDRAADR